MRAVVLQPMYLPWMGYFGLIDIADVFVFYDDVQFVRQSWQNRNRIKWLNGKPIWLTVPVQRQYGQMINQVRIDNTTPWRNKHWECIKQAYSKALFFREYAPILEPLYEKESASLADFDMSIILEMASALGLDRGKFKTSSSFPASGQGTERLIGILKHLRADEYVSGPSAAAYINTKAFKDAKIDLYWYKPEHPVYEQLWDGFVPYLSTLDLLFNAGEKSIQLIREVSRNAVQRDPET